VRFDQVSGEVDAAVDRLQDGLGRGAHREALGEQPSISSASVEAARRFVEHTKSST